LGWAPEDEEQQVLLQGEVSGVEPIGREFMRKTSFEYLQPSDQMTGMAQPPLEVAYAGDGPIIDMRSPESLSVTSIPLRDAIDQRESVRKFGDTPLTLDELSFLLWSTQGVKKTMRDLFTFRTVPSAGARHCLETYILANNVEGVEPGLYRYLALTHRLAGITLDPHIADSVVAACVNQRFLRENAVTFIWTADAYRMTWRYGERGYRYMHIDVGHVCQNLYLAAQAVNCGVCAVGAFHDDELNCLLGIDGEKQFALYLAAVGKID
jgi:SagB-type dehydrogenase family enzyme